MEGFALALAEEIEARLLAEAELELEGCWTMVRAARLEEDEALEADDRCFFLDDPLVLLWVL